MIYDVIIVGGGLSGLFLAHRLQQQYPHTLFKLLEARSVLGGRLKNDSLHQTIDLGGAWIWPDFQPHMKRLVRQLGVTTFPQPGDPQSTRIQGGAVELIHQLSKRISGNTVLLNTPVIKCTLVTRVNTDGDDNATTKVIEVETHDHQTFQARQVVLAVPPRVIAKHITFDPPLSPEKWSAMQQSHTWMAGVTKVALVYSKRFWNLDYANMGLPRGSGPAFQMYDSSTTIATTNNKNYDDNNSNHDENQEQSQVAAMTFFALVPSNTPAYSNDDILAKLVARQLADIWKAVGDTSAAQQAPSFSAYHIHRWPLEPYISEDATPKTIQPHPHPVHELSTTEWNLTLHFAGSEADRTSPGVMEGAVGSAERVMKELEPYLWSKAATAAAKETEKS